jgi:hypothetical protein
MKAQLLFISAVLAFMASPVLAAEDFSQVSGIKDACVAGSLLDANHIPYTVVAFHSLLEQSAGCLYRLNGKEYLYTVKGSARVNASRVARVPLEKISRDEVMRIADGDRDLRNGCMVFATCAFSQCKKNPHITWAGVIEAQIVDVKSYGFDSSYSSSINGHVITAFENDKREVYIEENGEDPRKIDRMTEQAQRGDMSWCDSLALISSIHHVQAITDFKEQFGHPR